MVKLSIITINFNNLKGLEKTMKSVLAQTFIDYEYIVIDGGSTDGSEEYIAKNTEKLTYWISEKDKGIYEAMNKGILKANGEYLLFLNSGDYLLNDNSIPKIFESSEGQDIIYGSLIIDYNGEQVVATYPDKLNFSYFLSNTLPHQSSFIKRSLFNSVGLYNEKFKSTSDWEFFIKAICKYNATYKYIPITLSVFHNDGISSKPENQEWIKADKKEALKNHFPVFLDDYAKLKYLELVERKLLNIESSRFWKIRNQIFHSVPGKLLFRNKH